MNPYLLILLCSTVIILSFFFNIVAKKTNLPSVLLLIVLGMVIKSVMSMNGMSDKDLGLETLLEVLGNIGLVMIVLEASLDLKLDKDKKGLILRSLAVAAISLTASIFLIGGLFYYIFPGTTFYTSAVYAVPLSIMSSAIILPSVGALRGPKREFMVYESTFSDILGIMVFYFMLGEEGSSGGTSFSGIVQSLFLTIVLSVISAYALVYVFQHLKMQVKLFLIVAVLLFMYALGKYYHLSSLLTILAFGLVLNNSSLFFPGKWARFFDRKAVEPIVHDFHKLTLESAFLLRTFFFVLFGISVSLASLYDWRVAINGVALSLILYAVRFLTLRFLSKENLFPEMWLAPRGLITVLLFFVILKDHRYDIQGFDPGLLLYPILITSTVMAIALIRHRGEKVKEVLLAKIPGGKASHEGQEETLEQRMEKNVENEDFDGF